MRFATNSLSSDHRSGTPGVTARRICRFIVSLHDAISTCHGMQRGYEQKARVLLESAIKCEQCEDMACHHGTAWHGIMGGVEDSMSNAGHSASVHVHVYVHACASVLQALSPCR